MIALVPDKFRQLNGVFEFGTGMAGHEIGHQILLLAQLFIHGRELVHEPFIDLAIALAHHAGHPVGDMLRCNLELTADMMLAEFLQEFILGQQQIVKPHAGTHKDLLNTGKGPQFAQKFNIVAVVGHQILAGNR